MSSNLVTIHNQEENVYVQHRHNGETSWIGLNDRSVEGSFEWANKEANDYRFWAPKQPNNFNNEDCVHTLGAKHGYVWDDVPCNNCYNFTCFKDIDECSTNLHGCDANEICHNAMGSYNCTCKPGFKGNGKNCTDIDECTTNSHACDVNEICKNTVGSYNCTCKPGFKGDGKKCTYYIANSAILSNNVFYQSRLQQFLTPAVGSNPRWVLCYRASTHGWAASTFHNRCDGKRDTVTIIKKGQYVFGGYTDIPWESGGSYTSTSNAFIFSLRNKEGLGPFKSMVTKPQYAIYRASGYGPTFGGGHDIRIANNANSNTYSYTGFGNSYSVPSGVQSRATILAGTYKFTPDDVEVFYLG